MKKQPLPPSEPIPPGFSAATPPWMWKVTYGVLGVAIGALTMTVAILIGTDAQKKADKARECWEPPPAARAWAYPEVSSDGTPRPLICARKDTNNDGMFPHSHRCLRMVPCEDIWVEP